MELGSSLVVILTLEDVRYRVQEGLLIFTL
jgi:hypothetical protein